MPLMQTDIQTTRTVVSFTALAMLAAVLAVVAGCGGSDSVTGAGPTAEAGIAQVVDPLSNSTDAQALDAAMDADVAADVASAAGGPKLIVRLTKQLDEADGNLKAPTFQTAELLDTNGSLVRNGTIISNVVAKFPTGQISSGDYFVRINGIDRALVPTRIDNPLVHTKQFVGKKLKTSVIGGLTDPTYRIRTFPQGGTQRVVVGYTTSLKAPPGGFGYAMINLKSANQEFETRVLGTARLLATADRGQDGPHSHTSWLMGASHHGSSGCGGCHGNLSAKPASYSSISKENGWCFQCHNGPTGPSSGIIDPSQ